MQTPGVLELLPEPAVEREGRLDVRGGLHVDEQVLAHRSGALGETAQALERLLGVEVQAEVCRLHGDLGVEPSFLDQVQQREVVVGDGVGIGGILDVLPQVRERRGDAVGGESLGRRDRILHPLAGHEPGHHRADEPVSREMGGEPSVPGGEEDRVASRVHGRMASISRPARRPVSIAPSM